MYVKLLTPVFQENKNNSAIIIMISYDKYLMT